MKPVNETRTWRLRPRLLAVGLPVLLAVFAANHLENHARQQRVRSAAEAGSLVVRAESGAAGHNQIGIDESALKKDGGRPFLRFSLLGQWDYDPQKPSGCPAAIQELSGREASCVGFMYPLEAGSEIHLFCLLRTTQTCCYGPRPQYSQYVFVEMPEPVKFERFSPVVVSGKFVVDPQPEQGYIYRMEGRSAVPAAGDEPELSAAQVARREKAALFDFAALGEAGRTAPPAELPAALRELDGQSVAVGGFVLARKDGPPPQVVVGREWWDGRGAGRPPTSFTALSVFLKTAQEIPPVWQQKDVFVGTLRVNADRAAWDREGVVSLQGAVRASGGEGGRRLLMDGGPFLAVWHEALILAAFLFLCFRGGPAGAASAARREVP